MNRVLLPREPAGSPISTIVFVDGLIARGGKRRLFVRLACGHEKVLSVTKGGRGAHYGDRIPCRSCATLRTPRAYREVIRLAKLGLTEKEVEYLAGRLAEQRDRKDGAK